MMTYKKTNHLLHLILTVFTGGAWSLVWIAAWLRNENYNTMVDQINYFNNQEKV